jgi:hypothetical protein
MVNTPIENHRDNALEQRSRDLFNEQVANHDGRTRSRLNQARQAALEAARSNNKWSGAGWLVPTGSMAALALVGIVSLQLLGPDQALNGESVVVASVVDDLEVITANAELELLQNMDFYLWLDSQPDTLTRAEEG